MLGLDIDTEMIESVVALFKLFPAPALKEYTDDNGDHTALAWKPEEYPLEKLQNLTDLLNDCLPMTLTAIELSLTESEGKGKAKKDVKNKYHAIEISKEGEKEDVQS